MYNRVPKPFPILFGLPDDPKPRFIWMKYEDSKETALKGRLSKRVVSEQFHQQPKIKEMTQMYTVTQDIQQPKSQQHQQNQGLLKYSSQSQQNIYYEDFNILINHLKQTFNPIKSQSELENFKHVIQYESNHPREYEIFSGFEGANVFEVYYCKPDVIKIVLRSDTNSHGFCQWFSFGVKVNKEIKLNFCIINLRASEKQGTVHIQHNGEECYIPSKYSQTKEKRRKGGFFYQCWFEMQCSYGSYIISYKKPFSFSYLNSHQGSYGQLGLSILKYPIYYWSQRKPGPLYLIIARLRPVDTVTSYLAEELITQVQMTELNVIVIPMLNTDGVLLGNSRCNLHGKDLCLSFQYPNPILCPEIKSVLGVENVHIAIFYYASELRMHQIPHVVSNMQFDCGLPRRNKNKEIHDISTQYQRYVKIFVSNNLTEYKQQAKAILKALQQQGEGSENNISFNSVTVHEDDILDNFYFNTVQEQKKVSQQVQLKDLLCTISPSQKEIESVNQLRNLEWKELTNRSEMPSAKLKTPLKEPVFFERKSIRNMRNCHLYSESQHSQSGQKEKVVPKNPFLPSREDIFKQYSTVTPKKKQHFKAYTSYQVLKQ